MSKLYVEMFKKKGDIQVVVSITKFITLWLTIQNR